MRSNNMGSVRTHAPLGTMHSAKPLATATPAKVALNRSRSRFMGKAMGFVTSTPASSLEQAERRSGVHPREWTRSGCGFDHLPGVLLFEPDGAPISERGMEPLAVVDLVD